MPEDMLHLMAEPTRASQRQPSSRAYLTPVVVVVTNVIVLGRLLRNWHQLWSTLAPGHPWTWLVARFGPVDWFFLLVPIAGVTFELARSRWSGMVNVLGHLSVFLWLVLVFVLASTKTFGFSEPEHVILAVISTGVPALGISLIFAWLFHRAHRLNPSSLTSAGT